MEALSFVSDHYLMIIKKHINNKNLSHTLEGYKKDPP